MFGKISIVFVPLIIGCAEPKYVSTNSDGLVRLQESKVDCPVVFSKSKTCLTWYWESKPTSNESGGLIFKTYHLNLLDQTPVEEDLPGVAQVVLWMPSMGHGSTPTQTTRVDVGTYRVSDVFFVMPGAWEIRFQAQQGTETIDEAKVNFVF